jgi:hypothetical protein
MAIAHSLISVSEKTNWQVLNNYNNNNNNTFKTNIIYYINQNIQTFGMLHNLWKAVKRHLDYMIHFH